MFTVRKRRGRAASEEAPDSDRSSVAAGGETDAGEVVGAAQHSAYTHAVNVVPDDFPELLTDDGPVRGATSGPELDNRSGTTDNRATGFARTAVFVVLPLTAMALAAAVGAARYYDGSLAASADARWESTRVAKESIVALLSYEPTNVDQQLQTASDLLTGEFKDSYAELTRDVVIPAAKKDRVTVLASVPAVASVSADPNRAVALVFVNQSVVVGDGAPTDSASTVKVTMDRVDDRWLIAQFEPI